MKQKVALVLGSGGARGVAHIGVIESLLAKNFEITSIAGSSMGAVVGGIYAAGKLEAYKEWTTNFDKIDVFKLLDFTFSTQGFVRGERVFNEMRKLLGDLMIEDMQIPFAAIASNIRKQEEVVFETGKLMVALRASCAIPTVITPAYINGEEILDGGILNPIPLNRVKRTPGDILIAVDVNSSIPFATKIPETAVEIAEQQRYSRLLDDFKTRLRGFWPAPKEHGTPSLKKLGFFDLLSRSIDLMQERMTSLQIEKMKPDMVVKVSRDACGIFEFYKSKELIKEGAAAFDRAYEQYNYALEGIK